MAKRTNTAVWLEKYSRWQIKVQKDNIRKTFTSPTPGKKGQREANAKADAWLDDDVSSPKRVDQLWADYLEWAYPTPDGAPVPAGRKKAVYTGDSYLLPALGKMRIDAVNEGHLQSIINKAYTHGSLKKKHKQRRPQNLPLSRKTLMNIRADLVAFFKYCRRVARVTSLNPEGLTIPQGARYKGKQILQPEALKILFTVDTTKMYGKEIFDEFIYAYRFQAACGLRPGELIGLWVGDIKPTGEVRLHHSINVDGVETHGKNENAKRSFVMPPLAKAAYEAQLDLLRSKGIELNYNTPLFQIPNEHTYYGRWTRYLKSNNLPHISLYELRHTFVSIAKFLPEGQIRPIVGHSKSMDTFGTYGHLLTGEAEKTAEDLGAVFEQILSRA